MRLEEVRLKVALTGERGALGSGDWASNYPQDGPPETDQRHAKPYHG